MTMDELPSINSSTSISDNPELKNYYDKLLFKNKNGKSILDFQDKFHETVATVATDNTERVDFINGFNNNTSPLANNEPVTDSTSPSRADINRRSSKVTFTSLHPAMDTNSKDNNNNLAMYQPASVHHENNPIINNNVHPANGRRQSIFNFTENNSNNNNSTSTSTNTTIQNPNVPPMFSAFNFNGTPTDQNESINNNPISAGTDILPLANLASERRSSYISDSLIHHNYETPNVNNYPNNATYINNDYNYYNNNNNNNNNNRRSSQTMQTPATLLSQMFNTTSNDNSSQQNNYNSGYPYNRLPSVSTTNQNNNNNTSYAGSMLQNNNHYSNGNDNNNQRRNTQPALLPIDINRNVQNFNMSSNKNNQYNYLNFLNTPRYNPTTSNTSNNSNSNNGSDNGLILLNNKQLTSSADLQKIYEDCGKNYFSCEKVYSFIDYIIKLLDPSDNNKQGNDAKFNQTKKSMSNFLAFLKSCNLNYNPQSDAFISRDNSNNNNNHKNNSNNNNRRSSNQANNNNNNNNSTSSYLHYKPLALVSLKNGKLELLSIPQNSNLSMKRGDLIIIDGDRGKDLALVVEPGINLAMALIINFLKKKIHFDSLITNKNQHYPNDKFINTLINSTKGLTDELNPKLYDVIELIQLVVPSKQVLRFATPWEVSTNLHNKFQDELKALHIAQLKLKSLNNHDSSSTSTSSSSSTSPSGNNLNMNMPQQQAQQQQAQSTSQLNIKILNAEFQYDRKKLTFYYICEERNDFRELIKELFKFYKTRIWLCAIPNNLDIDKLYYDDQQYELAMYQNMMSSYINDDLNDSQFSQNTNTNNNNANKNNGGFIVAPPLNKLKLDDFQIGVYRELVNNLFSS